MNDERNPFTLPTTMASVDDDRRLRELLRGAGPREAVPPSDFDAIRDAARSEWKQLVAAEKRRRRGTPLAIAAMLALGLAVAWWWNGSAPDQGTVVATLVRSVDAVRLDGTSSALAVGHEFPAGTLLETGDTEGSGVSARLAGGASIRVDAGSRVRFDGTDRITLESGGLYFDSGSASAASGPVRVATPFGTVRDIGTRYEVRLDGARASLRVRVRDGAVALDSDLATGDTAVQAGEELRLMADGTVERSPLSEEGDTWAWAARLAPGIAIDGRPLTVFLDWLTRETGWTVAFTDAALESEADTITLHGSIEGLTPTESLEVVLVGAGLEHDLDSAVLRIGRTAASVQN